MIEAYKIAANLTITGDAHKKMMDFALMVEKATRDMDRLLRSMKMAGTMMGGMGTSTRLATTSLRQFNQSLVGMGRSATRVTNQVNTLRTSVNSLNVATRRAGGGRGGAGGGIGAAAMGFLSHRLAPGILAYEGYELGKASFNARAEYTSALAITKGMGYSPQVVKDVENATSTGKPGLSPITQIHAYNAALMATQNPSKAAKLFPTLAKAMSIAPTIFEGMGKHQLEEMTRGAEMLAGGNENKLAASLSDILAMMFTSGGTLMPNKIRQTINRNPNLSRLGLLELEPVMQEMGGDKIGTALQTGRMQFQKGQMGKYQALELHRLGILGAPEMDANGRPIGSKYGNMDKSKWDLYEKNPTEFLKRVILPAFTRAGVTKPEDVMNKIAFLFANSTGVLFKNIYKNLSKSNEIRDRSKKIPGIEGSAFFQPSEEKSIKRFTEAWTTFEVALGKFSSPAVIKGLDALSGFLENLARLLTHFSNMNLSDFTSGAKEGGSLAGAITGLVPHGAPKMPTVKVFMKGRTLFEIMTQNAPNQMVDHGMTAINPSYSGTSPSNNGSGGGVSP